MLKSKNIGPKSPHYHPSDTTGFTQVMVMDETGIVAIFFGQNAKINAASYKKVFI